MKVSPSQARAQVLTIFLELNSPEMSPIKQRPEVFTDKLELIKMR
jgi:hypothetical protein